jgi:glycosyltransferase involved in cell wall biosynthesis
VLHVGPCNARGGMATVMRTLAEHPPDGWSADLLPTYSEGGVWAKWRAYRRARRELIERCENPSYRPDVVHFHAASDWSWRRKIRLAGVARRWGVPVVIHLHSGKFDRWLGTAEGRRGLAVRAAHERLDACVVVLSEDWAARLGVHLGPLHVVNNPVHPRFQPGALPRDTEHLLLLGRDDPVKGHAFAIEVVDALRLKHPNLKLTMTGVASINHPNIDARGWVTDAEVLGLMQSATLLLVPSDYEGQPMVVLEALACGLPVLANTSLGSLPETAALAELNVQSWVNAIEPFLQHPQPPAMLPEHHRLLTIKERWRQIYEGSVSTD